MKSSAQCMADIKSLRFVMGYLVYPDISWFPHEQNYSKENLQVRLTKKAPMLPSLGFAHACVINSVASSVDWYDTNNQIFSIFSSHIHPLNPQHNKN